MFQNFSGVDNELLIKDGGCPVFASIFLTHSTGKFCGILFNVSRNFGYWKFSCIRNGYHYLPLNFLKVSEWRKVSWGNYSMFQIIRLWKKFLQTEEIPLLSVENFLSQSAEKILRQTLLCFKKMWYLNIWWIGEGGHHGNGEKTCPTRLKRKTWLRSPPVFQKSSGIGNFFEKGGEITIFRWKLIIWQWRKRRRGTLQCFRKHRVSKKFMRKKWISLFFIEVF